MVFCNGVKVTVREDNYCHNPYFNRWFSAISNLLYRCKSLYCHNPYFNRWFSAITKMEMKSEIIRYVTILILIDGFLQ